MVLTLTIVGISLWPIAGSGLATRPACYKRPSESRSKVEAARLKFDPEDPSEFSEKLSQPLPCVEAIEQSAWYQFRVAYVPLLAAVHWRLQVPREMLVKQAIAVATPNVSE